VLDWEQIDTVLLDMDGTLLDLHFDNYFWLQHLPLRYAEKHQLSAQQASSQLAAKIKHHEGSLNWYCLDFWSEALQLDIACLKREVQHKIRYRPQAEHFLKQLQQQGKTSYIVTNAHHNSIELKRQITGLDRWVDRIICAHDLALPKEDPAFWQQLQQHQPFDPDTTLLVDDSVPVLNSARHYGIRFLLTILQPDSQQPKRTILDYTGIEHFADIGLAELVIDG